MYENQTEDLIKQRMLSSAPEGVNTLEGDFFNDAVSPAAIELTLAYQELDELLKLGFADTSYGEYLDKIASEVGLSRKPATKSKGQIEVTMTVGSQIHTGDVLATWQGNIRFVAVETTVIGETGKALVYFENETAGNLGNVLANTAFVAPVAIPGFISAKNPGQINAGTGEESDESLRQRYFEKARTPVTSGNKHHYRNWAKEVAGVGDAIVLPLKNGPNTVKVVIIDSNKQPASISLVEAVQEYIDPDASGRGEGQAPIGAACTVAAAQALNINVSAALIQADPLVVKPIFENALSEYLKSLAFTTAYISYPQIGALLLDSIAKAGGMDYSGLLVNGGSSNIQVGQEQVAVKGTVIFS